MHMTEFWKKNVWLFKLNVEGTGIWNFFESNLRDFKTNEPPQFPLLLQYFGELRTLWQRASKGCEASLAYTFWI